MTSDATRVIPVTTTTTPPERPTFTTTTEKLEDNTPSRESTQELEKELEGEIEKGGFEGASFILIYSYSKANQAP